MVRRSRTIRHGQFSSELSLRTWLMWFAVKFLGVFSRKLTNCLIVLQMETIAWRFIRPFELCREWIDQGRDAPRTRNESGSESGVLRVAL